MNFLIGLLVGFKAMQASSVVYLGGKGIQYGLLRRLLKQGKSCDEGGLVLIEGLLNKEISEVEVVSDTREEKKEDGIFHLRINNGRYVTFNLPSFNLNGDLLNTLRRKRILELYQDEKYQISGWNGMTDLILNPECDFALHTGQRKTEICMPNTRLDDEKAKDILGGLVNDNILSDNHVVQRTVPPATNVIAVGTIDPNTEKLNTLYIGKESLVIEQIKNNHYYLHKDRIYFAAAILVMSTIGSFFLGNDTKKKQQGYYPYY